ncbi:MAG: hypothetical protein ACRDL7_10365, partial [Gaiellaceae bacterium]
GARRRPRSIERELEERGVGFEHQRRERGGFGRGPRVGAAGRFRAHDFGSGGARHERREARARA